MSADTADRSGPDELSGRHALVTGGTRGIGEAIVDRLTRAGATVAVVRRRQQAHRLTHRDQQQHEQENRHDNHRDRSPDHPALLRARPLAGHRGVLRPVR
ncbi:SDR family NAD(P)-dependent oxidoreductase [Streptomyces sp. NPDC001698]|uniref:SDR family NAD(P)-dependent oxidoreductase n=1 Tax=unclassified Streptomyces TaxID=2593676 RepID=UPI00368039A5